MKRDAIFYDVFQRFPSLLFAMVEQVPSQTQGYQFESVEVKQPDFRIDGVFLPPQTADVRTVYFAEFQMQKDEGLYHRFFSESLLYLYRNQDLYDDWYGVVIFASRSVEPTNQTIHRALLNSDQVERIYLDDLGDPSQQPVGISLLQLTMASESEMVTQARELMERVEQEDTGLLGKDEIIEVITTIAVYKFSDASREEVEAMLGIAFEESRVYRELQDEIQEKTQRQTNLKVIRKLADKGQSLESIADLLDLSVAEIQEMLEQDGA